MSKFLVEMRYQDKAFPTLELQVEARNREEAERKARENGRFMGFTGAIKKYVVRREVESA